MQSPPTGPNEPPGGWGVHLPPGVDPKQEAQATAGADSGAAISLALGVISAPLSFCCGAFAIVVNLVGVVLAVVAIRKSSREGGSRPLAIAALIVNALVLLLNVGLIGFFAYGAFGSRLFP